MTIRTSPRFERNYRKLSSRIKEQAKKKERIFRKDAFDTRLKTHKLLGYKQDTWAFSINYSYRIKFTFLRNKEVLFLDIGSHDIYK